MNKSTLFLSLLVVTPACVTGCGAGGPPSVEQASAKEVSDMKALRAIFDRTQGDYSKTTPEERKQFLDYAKGNQANVDHLWAFMTNPRGGGDTAPKPFATGPGGAVLPPGSGPMGNPR